ncbi:MAG: DUF814 domain-containing protein [bacterium]|nr:DUF814 domain-containing protein [bacterium]
MDFPSLLMASPLFDRLQGMRVDRVTWNGPVAVIVFNTHRESENLVIHLHQSVQGFHLDTTLKQEFEHIQFQDTRHDFSFLPPHLEGSIFLGAGVPVGQSLLRLDFAGGGNFKDDSPLHLFVEFFAGGRIILTDSDHTVIRASRKGGKHYKPGAQYLSGATDLTEFGQELPLPASYFSEWPHEVLDRVRIGGDKPLADDVCRGIRGFKSDSVRFLAQRERSHLNREPEGVLARRLARWIDKSRQGRLPVHILSYAPGVNRSCQVYPFNIDKYLSKNLIEQAIDNACFPDFVEAINFMGRNCLARLQMNELLLTIEKALHQRLARNKRLQANMELDWEKAADAGDMRRKADTLAAHLMNIPRGESAVRLEDIHGGDKLLEIKLNPAKSPQDNLDRLYKQAAKGERGLQTIELRLEEVRTRIAEDEECLHQELPALAASRSLETDDIAALRDALLDLGARTSLLDAPSPRSKPAAAPVPTPFRRYTLRGDWVVLVGRNNKENDTLTHKHAAQHDLWFHAAGVPGSHVILRTGGHKSGPPAAIIEATAAIAAFHSRARHSDLVPVIYTEKRYVRKPRKAVPGLAQCTREKTVFVKPEVHGEIPRKP